MNDDMIERVAKAIVARRNLPEGCAINWPVFRLDAHAAIEAMREPTNGMKEMVHYDPGSIDIYQSMVDAALGGDDGKDSNPA